VDDSLVTGAGIEKADVVISAVLAQLFNHRLSQWIAIRLKDFVGWHNMIDGRKGAVRVFHWQPAFTQHAESLRTGHLVNEMRSDQQLCLPVGQLTDGVSIPNFFVKALSHGSCGEGFAY